MELKNLKDIFKLLKKNEASQSKNINNLINIKIIV